METIMRDWSRTDKENVYLKPSLLVFQVTSHVQSRITITNIAKEAEFICQPKMSITHWSEGEPSEKISVPGPRPISGPVESPHRKDLSESKCPLSLASCSRVTGIKEPTPQTTNTSAAHAYEYQPISSFLDVDRTSWPGNWGIWARCERERYSSSPMSEKERSSSASSGSGSNSAR